MNELTKKIGRRLLSVERRRLLAMKLLGGSYEILKKRGGADLPASTGTGSGSSAFTPNILAALPHAMAGYLASEWFWADSYYPVYTEIARLLRPDSILEIGSLQGFSLISMLEGFPAVRKIVWADNEMYLPNSNQMCYENICHFYRTQHPECVLPELSFRYSTWDLLQYTKGDGFELIHIDGEHSFDGKLRDLMVCHSLKPNYILLDDYANTGNHKAIQYWAECNNLPFIVIDTFDRGLAVFDFTDGQSGLAKLKNGSFSIKEKVRC